MNRNDYLKNIPKVDRILKEDSIQELCDAFGRGIVTEAVRYELANLRSLICAGEKEEIDRALRDFMRELPEKIREFTAFSLRKVVNATGIILHTNLGRAPLGKVQMDGVMQAMAGYSNLEYDLSTGTRGKRTDHCSAWITRVVGCEHATVVNNNAAAVTLMLSALAKDKEVIVSRGELIEIGGRFRIPDVMEQSGACLREVGTTNRTRISDYERAITENTGAIMKVHTSNYKIMGFTEEASVEELVELGARYHLPVIVDLGSGVLIDLERFGLAHEPTVQEMLKKGADLVCFSGDKLLGGPQAGIIAGKREYIEKMANHPLMRTFRPDKCTIAALAATFREYLEEDRAIKNIPILSMLSRSSCELKEQAETLCALLQHGHFPACLHVEESITRMGGGSLPGEELPGYAVTMAPTSMSCEKMAAKMRQMPTPVIAHIKDNRIWMEMRTIPESEVAQLSQNLIRFFA